MTNCDSDVINNSYFLDHYLLNPQTPQHHRSFRVSSNFHIYLGLDQMC